MILGSVSSSGMWIELIMLVGLVM